MPTQHIIQIENGVCRMPAWRMAQPVNFTLCAGEHIAIVGPNGGGKSMFVDMIIGAHPLLMREPAYDFAPSTKKMVSENIRYITFRDAYGGDNDKTYYLQQRWNQMEIDESTPTVGQRLEEVYLQSGDDTAERRARQRELYHLFQIDMLLDKYIILLSSGELRKLKLTETLLTQPRVIIMDNPFIGLDTETRQLLLHLLETIAQGNSIQLVLVLSKLNEIPPFITHVVEVKHMTVCAKRPLEVYLQHQHKVPSHLLSAEKEQAIRSLPYKAHEYHTDVVARLNHVSIRYGQRTILNNLNWTVRNGERWALDGQNGAGKSTLLSLVCADNPQAYACEIELFGNVRGTGESIWDIKKHIGYVSPEMHRACQQDMPAIRIVASGLKDSIGLYVKPHDEEYEICRFWMNIFGLNHLEDTSFLKLSSGEQRLVLLARAFVKDPELLILDEPLHGLDDSNRQLVKDVIEAFCHRQNKTLIMVSHYAEEFPPCIDHHLHLIKQQ